MCSSLISGEEDEDADEFDSEDEFEDDDEEVDDSEESSRDLDSFAAGSGECTSSKSSTSSWTETGACLLIRLALEEANTAFNMDILLLLLFISLCLV